MKADMIYQVQTYNWNGQKGWVSTGGIQPRSILEAVAMRDRLATTYPGMILRAVCIHTITTVFGE